MYKIGDKVKVPAFNIDKGIIVGIQCYYLEEWVQDIEQINLMKLDIDYLITHIENGKITEDWFPGGCIE